jgi:pimeloyl-ACP methyl ester carboxylesterase
LDIAIIDGVEIAYRLAGPESADPVLLIHGYTGNHRNWAYTAKALLAAGFRTLSPDNPGHGDSAGPDGFDDYELSHVAESLHQLASALDFAPAIVVGHSMGGAIAEEYAARHPGSVRALVLVGSAGGASGRERESMAEHIDDLRAIAARDGMGAVFDQQVKLGLRPGIEALDAATRALLRSEFARTSWNGYEYGGLALRTRAETLTRLSSFERPALVVHGENESPTLIAVAADLVATLPNARRMVIAGAGHSPQIEAPQAFDRALLDFLESIPRGRP